MIELYAITDHTTALLPDVAPLRLVAAGALAAVYAPAGDGAVSPEALWRHEAVVEALMGERDVLPVRYGTRFDDESAAADAIASRSADLAAALDRVRGAVELSLRALDPNARQPDDGAGYLRAQRRRQQARRSLHEPLAAIARAATERPPRPPSELLRAAYLVDRSAVARVTERVERLQDANPGLRLLCTGPWPAYSFVQA